MSIRIQNDAISSGVSPEINRTSETGHASGGSGRGRVGAATAGGDQVEISSAAQTFSEGVHTASPQHSARVKELSALYASGRYHVDSHQVSRALVNSGISSAAPSAGKA
ncbi:MAG TPA: flagellar biosynthesis anti-sigma factor FlgM [Bryobacteraceae bacterium]|jgi:anti-sigma28 factor (negative regulator of flagellin synthesis)|nr:flagellar biosynthesis anti-sigma factor FlgM [Bryobacteraceae bacterium]